MNVEINYTQIKQLQYPKLLQSLVNNEVVFTIKENSLDEECFEGFVLSKDSPTSTFGDYCEMWLKTQFKPFEGSITLSNESVL